MCCATPTSCARPKTISAIYRKRAISRKWWTWPLQLISENTKPFKPEVFKNSYEVALLDLIKEKSKGQKIKAPEPERAEKSGGNVVDLMEALKKSVTGKKSREPAKSAAKKPRGKKAG